MLPTRQLWNPRLLRVVAVARAVVLTSSNVRFDGEELMCLEDAVIYLDDSSDIAIS